MMRYVDQLIKDISGGASHVERSLVSDLLEEEGRLEEAQLLRTHPRVCYRHCGERWWIEGRPRALCCYYGSTYSVNALLGGGTTSVWYQRGSSHPRPLSIRPSLRLRHHSPDGFAWGYNGSGPAQLALALLLHCAGRELACAHYQEFKRDVVASWRGQGWEMLEEGIWLWLDDQPPVVIDPESMIV